MTLKNYKEQLYLVAKRFAEQGYMPQAMGIYLALFHVNRLNNSPVRGLLGKCGITPTMFIKYAAVYSVSAVWYKIYRKGN